jgi:polysaccharide pyruvyl transferase WcaK-like protein
MILAGDSDHDLGARATILGLCGAFHHADPAVEITLVSGRADHPPPPGTVKLIPRGPAGLSRFIKSVGTQDLVIVINGVFRDTPSRPTLPYRAARMNLFNLLSRNLRTHALSPRSTPDPAFALAPASPEAAVEYLGSIGIDPARPLIGVAVRGRPQERRFTAFLPPGIRDRVPGIGGDGDDDSEASMLLQQVADATTVLAGRKDAAILLMPACQDPREDDARYCHELAGMLQGHEVRVATIDDPHLYKAVCGRLELIISARMHPLILAAGMGVPGVALGNGGAFEDIFDTLGLPRRLISFDEYREGQAERLVVLGQSALDHPGEVRERADFLRQRVMHEAASLLGRRIRVGSVATGSSE